MKGSPTKLSRQIQLGMWFTIKHWAFRPQDPGQGSLHFRLIHARFLEQSPFVVHSGLQLGGTPI